MTITREQILKIMPNASSRVDLYVGYLNKYMKEMDINNYLRVCHFLAQIAHESSELRYTTELGNMAYFKKYDPDTKIGKVLGNTTVGDGYKFRGRGLIQITGRANYMKYRDYCGFDVVVAPDLLSQPLGATRSACWFFAKYAGLNPLADKDSFTTITKRINGGTNGINSRREYLRRAKLAIPKDFSF